MELTYTNAVSTREYLALRGAVGWIPLCEEQAEQGLKGSAFVAACRDDETLAGMARVVWDGGYIAYLSDVMVRPQYQGRGVGSGLVRRAIAFVRSQLKENWRIKLVLIASKGKEPFYERFGFCPRPNQTEGAGMHLWLT